jgi:long-chain acyl-CoA synthetase
MSVVVEFTTVPELFDRTTTKYAAERRPILMKKVGNEYQGISFTEYRREVERFALGLASLGVKQDDRVAIIAENRPEWVVADMGIVALGAVDVPICLALTPPQIAYILNDTGARIVVVSNSLQLGNVLKIQSDVKSLERIIPMNEKSDQKSDISLTFQEVFALGARFEKKHPEFFRKALSRVKPQDLLTIIYASGTTGNPKGVMLTHGNLCPNIKAAAEIFPLGPTDTLLSFLPLCHSFERMAGDYTAMSCGCTVAYAESAETVRDNLLEVRPTVVTTVPRLFERIYSRIINEKEIQTLQKDLPTYERVRRFELLPEQLTVDNGEITPTLKVKRRRNVDGLLWKGLSQKRKRHSEPRLPEKKTRGRSAG